MFKSQLQNLFSRISIKRVVIESKIRKMSLLSQEEIFRYGRQLILPQFGPEGQLKLKNTSVLIVGCGGLGCPSSQYLTAAGIGRIGLIDNDLVEISNLHRQILHSEANIGKAKTESAAEALCKINSTIEIEKFQTRLTASNAFDLVEKFDIILDATDNAATRYLLSDVCVLSKKPLVSGSALRFDGQLTVYNYDENTPCYRCLFPNPPPPGTVTNCSEGGVVGVVPGIIGSMQALETIKIALGLRPSFAGKMLLFDGLDGILRSVKIRNKNPNCISCGMNSSITKELIDYDAFIGTPPCFPELPKILDPSERITAFEYKEKLDNNEEHLLIDVRPEADTKIAKIAHSINIPLNKLKTDEGFKELMDLVEKTGSKKIFVMCRRGGASQIAVRHIKNNWQRNDIEIHDVIGGITTWSDKIDPNIPFY